LDPGKGNTGRKGSTSNLATTEGIPRKKETSSTPKKEETPNVCWEGEPKENEKTHAESGSRLKVRASGGYSEPKKEIFKHLAGDEKRAASPKEKEKETLPLWGKKGIYCLFLFLLS